MKMTFDDAYELYFGSHLDPYHKLHPLEALCFQANGRWYLEGSAGYLATVLNTGEVIYDEDDYLGAQEINSQEAMP
ncbi:MAG: hypothetical protein KGZ39_05635 [Simkania sp.]|nr:hypothetical protein [Simkania sp.]